MFLYTTIPPELIFENSTASQAETVSLQNCIFEGVKNSTGFKVTRLISTLPKDYLNESYMPGMTIKI